MTIEIPRLGAHVEEGGTRFTLFTTTTPRASVQLFEAEGKARSRHELLPVDGAPGYHSLHLDDVGAGALYKFVLDEAELPDPYARFLPHGVHGPAMVVGRWEPSRWRHGAGIGRPLREHVIYELHVGTFSPEGTYDGVRPRLRGLADLGVTAIELMPVATFAGRRGWGYDGVAHFAPFAAYGTPDQLRALIDEAHGLGLSVLLDVVYNHFGPAGNYLGAYAPEYFTREAGNPWGEGPSFTYPPMRGYVLENARQWLDEYRFDGLRLDAIHTIHDPSPRHILRELADLAATLESPKVLIGEDDRNDPAAINTLGLNGIWADDFHHQLRVTMTGERDGYFAAYQPGAAGIAETVRKGWLFTGQQYAVSGRPAAARGRPADDLAADAFIYCIQNHDQVGNRALGDRLSHAVPPDLYAAASMLLLFLPMTPLLFQGQEWAASSPFQYFTDHEAELGHLVSAGRRKEFKGFAAFSGEDAWRAIPDPQEERTFLASKLDWSERSRAPHAEVLAFYQTMLRLRATDPVLSCAPRGRLLATSHGGVLTICRWHGEQGRLLAVNLGGQPATWKGLGFRLSAAVPMLDSRGKLAASLGSSLAAREAVLLSLPLQDVLPLGRWASGDGQKVEARR